MSKTFFNLSIFRGINKQTVEHIILNSLEESYKAGEIIIMQGSPSNGEGYIIKSGKVKVSISGNKIAELNSGDIVGEIALLNEEERTATVEALEDTDVIVLTLDSMINMLNNDDNSINKEIIRRIEENLENS